MKVRFNAEGAEVSQRAQINFARFARDSFLCVLRASSATSALNLFLRLTLALSLSLPMAGCGTKTELLQPDGKPNPAGTKDPSQPPSPISR